MRAGIRIARGAIMRLLGGLILTAGLSACGGDNAFRDAAGVGPDDGKPPRLSIEEPAVAQRVAVGDSIRVLVKVRDQQGVAELLIEGVSVTGSAHLGTRVERPRFAPKNVDLSGARPAVRDTTIERYLLATSDSAPSDSAYVIVTARDYAGNTASSRAAIAIGGPRIQIVEPEPGAGFRPGAQIRVRLTARDTLNRILSVTLSSTGGETKDTILTFEPPRASVDTIVELALPSTTPAGAIELRATARNTANDVTASAPVRVDVLPAASDEAPPLVRFRASSPTRAERNDTVRVTVLATDNVRVDSVGVTFLAIHRLGTGTDTLAHFSRSAPSDSATFGVSLEDLGLPVVSDTSTLRIETTAYAIDASMNCATATQPTRTGTMGYSDECSGDRPITGPRSGARYDVLTVRGRTIQAGGVGDTIVDMAANGTHLYLTNLSRNRVEVLPIGGVTFLDPVRVGSKPWGLAFNADKSRLYVANSGGTNISVVSPISRVEENRILTPNVKLFDVPFEVRRVPDPENPADSVQSLSPTLVTAHDYSDRPQFIGVTANENLIFSTAPTSAAIEGTVRVYRTGQQRLEIVTDYAEERIGSRLVIANADSAFLVPVLPDNLIRVCPRNRSRNPALDRRLPESCYVGSINEVEEQIAAMGYDTRFQYNLNIQEIGLSDTTFVAVSGDHRMVAVGEGARTHGRVVVFEDVPGQADGPLVKFGEIRDLIGNAAERVIGLALNVDGSLGVGRGSEAFFFSKDLRLQGEVTTGSGYGGVDMHPENPTVDRAFVSGVEPNGLAFIDVIDSLHFGRVSRIFLRDAVIGPIRAVRAPGGSLMLYAITSGGLVSLTVNAQDLAR